MDRRGLSCEFLNFKPYFIRRLPWPHVKVGRKEARQRLAKRSQFFSNVSTVSDHVEDRGGYVDCGGALCPRSSIAVIEFDLAASSRFKSNNRGVCVTVACSKQRSEKADAVTCAAKGDPTAGFFFFFTAEDDPTAAAAAACAAEGDPTAAAAAACAAEGDPPAAAATPAQQGVIHVRLPQQPAQSGVIHVRPPQQPAQPGVIHVRPPQQPAQPGVIHVRPPQQPAQPGVIHVRPPQPTAQQDAAHQKALQQQIIQQGVSRARLSNGPGRAIVDARASLTCIL